MTQPDHAQPRPPALLVDRLMATLRDLGIYVPARVRAMLAAHAGPIAPAIAYAVAEWIAARAADPEPPTLAALAQEARNLTGART